MKHKSVIAQNAEVRWTLQNSSVCLLSAAPILCDSANFGGIAISTSQVVNGRQEIVTAAGPRSLSGAELNTSIQRYNDTSLSCKYKQLRAQVHNCLHLIKPKYLIAPFAPTIC